MIVMRVASSHQISTWNQPSVPAQLVTKATTIAREMRVIMPGSAVGQLAAGTAQEDEPAVDEDDGPEDRRNERVTREAGAGYPSQCWADRRSRSGPGS